MEALGTFKAEIVRFLIRKGIESDGEKNGVEKVKWIGHD